MTELEAVTVWTNVRCNERSRSMWNGHQWEWVDSKNFLKRTMPWVATMCVRTERRSGELLWNEKRKTIESLQKLWARNTCSKQTRISINLKIINNHLSVKRKRSLACFTTFLHLQMSIECVLESTAHTARWSGRGRGHGYVIWSFQFKNDERPAQRTKTHNYKRIHRVFSKIKKEKKHFFFFFLEFWRLHLITNELSISRFSKEMNRNQIHTEDSSLFLCPRIHVNPHFVLHVTGTPNFHFNIVVQFYT